MKMKASDRLQSAKLWDGSGIMLTNKYAGGLLRAHIVEKITALEKCDDRTKNEDEFLMLLRQELIRFGG